MTDRDAGGGDRLALAVLTQYRLRNAGPAAPRVTGYSAWDGSLVRGEA
ncbi:hypothetical protein [Streptomyces sp. NPDC007856]